MAVSIYILDSKYEILAVFENVKKDANLLSAEISETLSPPMMELVFAVKEKSEGSEFVKSGNYALYRDPDLIEHLFYIDYVDEEGAETRSATCSHVSSELADEPVISVNKTSATAKDCMIDVMSGSTWELSVVDSSLGLKDLSIKNKSKLEALQVLADTFEGEILFETKFEGRRLRKFVSLVKSRGEYTGKRFEYAKDIIEITRTVDTTEVKTALYGVGQSYSGESGDKGSVSFADVEWSVANGDPVNKPLGQTYVGIDLAKELYGREGGTIHRFGFYEGAQTSDPELLLIETYKELLKVCMPKTTYSMKVVDLERLAGYSHEKVSIGDTVLVFDEEFKTPLQLEARVIELKRDLLSPENTDITLGNYKELFTDLLDKVNELEALINENAGIWDNKLDALNLDHYSEFGSIIYSGSANAMFEFNFSQVYIETPIIHAQTQLMDESINDVTEIPQIIVQPIKTGKYYTGGQVKLIRQEATNRRFLITIQSICTAPKDDTEETV